MNKNNLKKFYKYIKFKGYTISVTITLLITDDYKNPFGIQTKHGNEPEYGIDISLRGYETLIPNVEIISNVSDFSLYKINEHIIDFKSKVDKINDKSIFTNLKQNGFM